MITRISMQVCLIRKSYYGVTNYKINPQYGLISGIDESTLDKLQFRGKKYIFSATFQTKIDILLDL